MTIRSWVEMMRTKLLSRRAPRNPSNEIEPSSPTRMLLDLRGVMLHAGERTDLAQVVCRRLTDVYGYSLARLEWTDAPQEPPAVISCSHDKSGQTLIHRFDSDGDFYPFIAKVLVHSRSHTEWISKPGQEPLAVAIMALKEGPSLRGWLATARMMDDRLDESEIAALEELAHDLSAAIHRALDKIGKERGIQL